MHNHVVVMVSPDGTQLSNHHFADRAFSNATFDSQGNIYLGEGLVGNTPYPGSYLKRLPGLDILGYGNIYKYNQEFELIQVFDVANSPEFHQFKGVTHSTIHPSENFITYTTEIGKKVMRYDIVNDQQMEDLVVLPGDLTDKVVAIAVNYLPDGNLLHTRGDYFEVLDDQGNVIKTVSLSKHGWGIAQITPAADGEHVFTANIFSGVMLKVRLDDGAVVGSIDTGFKVPKRSLGGVAEYNN